MLTYILKKKNIELDIVYGIQFNLDKYIFKFMTLP